MDSRRRVAADIVLACLVAVFLVAGAAFTASALLGPRRPLSFAASTATTAGVAATPDAPLHRPLPRIGQGQASATTAPSPSLPRRVPTSTPGRSGAVARASTDSARGDGLQAGGDIRAGDGSGSSDGA